MVNSILICGKAIIFYKTIADKNINIIFALALGV